MNTPVVIPSKLAQEQAIKDMQEDNVSIKPLVMSKDIKEFTETLKEQEI